MWKEVLQRMVSRDIAVVVSTSESTKMNMYGRSAVVFVIAHTLLLAEHLSPEQVEVKDWTDDLLEQVAQAAGSGFAESWKETAPGIVADGIQVARLMKEDAQTQGNAV
jgi:hypothetical protein